MTLIEGIKLTGKPALITGCSRKALPAFFKELGFKVGAEIGVAQGYFTKLFLDQGIKMYAIDPWMPYVGAGRPARTMQHHNGFYEAALETFKPYGDLVTLVRKTSHDALVDIADNSLDFVYIDGNHDLPHATQDIYEWNRKIRSGGIISGHDYFNTRTYGVGTLCHVKAAVDAFVSLARPENWWVIAHLSRKVSDDHHDRSPSWFWFKP